MRPPITNIDGKEVNKRNVVGDGEELDRGGGSKNALRSETFCGEWVSQRSSQRILW